MLKKEKGKQEIPNINHQQNPSIILNSNRSNNISPLKSTVPRALEQNTKNCGKSDKNVSQMNSAEKFIAIDKTENMSLLIAFMRQQIEIANKSYSDRIKVCMMDQAKEIVKLRTKILENQKQLQKKNNQIENLLNDKTPKKKLSIISNQIKQQLKSTEVNKLYDKICNLQQRLSLLCQNLSQKHALQSQMNLKIEEIEKKVLKYLNVRLLNCSSKLEQFMSKKQRELQRVYTEYTNLIRSYNQVKSIQSLEGQSSKLATSKTSSQTKSQQKGIQLIHKQLERIKKQMNEVKSEIDSIKQKEYKYDSYAVQKLKQQVNKIKICIDQYCKGQNWSQNRNCGHDSNSKIQSQKNIQISRRLQNSKKTSINLNNLTKSQKMINTTHTSKRSPQHYDSQPIKQKISLKNNLNYSSNVNKNMTKNEPPASIYYGLKQPSENQSLILNCSTPNLMRGKSENINNNQSSFMNYTNNQFIGLNKTKSIQFIKQNDYRHLQYSEKPYIKNNQKYIKRPEEHKESQWEGQSQKSLQYEDSQCQSYEEVSDEDQDQYYAELEERLLETIKSLGLKTPLKVQIDQTACLKCAENGMYLLDCQNDVFSSEDSDSIDYLIKRGVIKLA